MAAWMIFCFGHKCPGIPRRGGMDVILLWARVLRKSDAGRDGCDYALAGDKWRQIWRDKRDRYLVVVEVVVVSVVELPVVVVVVVVVEAVVVVVVKAGVAAVIAVWWWWRWWW